MLSLGIPGAPSHGFEKYKPYLWENYGNVARVLGQRAGSNHAIAEGEKIAYRESSSSRGLDTTSIYTIIPFSSSYHNGALHPNVTKLHLDVFSSPSLVRAR